MPISENVKSLIKNSRVPSIDLTNYGFDDEDVAELATLLAENKNIRDVCLNSNNITAEYIHLFAENTNLKKLDLSFNQINDKTEKNMDNLKKLAQSSIKYLDLGNNNISDRCAEMLLQNTKQIFLNLARNPINHELRLKIETRIKLNKTEEINMSLELLNSVEQILKETTGDISIDLSNQGLSDDNLQKLINLLAQYPNTKIKYLNLYCNDISDQGATMLADLHNIKNINLCYNRIKDIGAKALIAKHSIEELDLSNNNISNDCGEYIINNTKQIYLNLVKNKIETDLLAKIEKQVQTNKAKSDFSHNFSALSIFSHPKKTKNEIPSKLLAMFKSAFEFLCYYLLNIGNESVTRIFITILKDKSYSQEEVLRFADNSWIFHKSLVKSIDVIYCALHPEKWDISSFKEHKIHLLDDTAKFSLPMTASEQEKNDRIEQLKIIAKITTSAFFENQIILDAEEELGKAFIFERMNQSSTATSSSSSKSRRTISRPKETDTTSIIDDYLLIYCHENNAEFECRFNPEFSSSHAEQIKNIDAQLEKPVPKKESEDNTSEKWKSLSKFSSPEWEDIYALIKYSKFHHLKRKKNDMLEVVKAILYQKETKTFWKMLPQSMISGTVAYYYEQLWTQEGLLPKILQLAGITPDSQKTVSLTNHS